MRFENDNPTSCSIIILLYVCTFLVNEAKSLIHLFTSKISSLQMIITGLKNILRSLSIHLWIILSIRIRFVIYWFNVLIQDLFSYHISNEFIEVFFIRLDQKTGIFSQCVTVLLSSNVRSHMKVKNKPNAEVKCHKSC